MDDRQIEALEEMLADSKSEILLKKSFGIFKISRENIISRLVIGILSMTISFAIGHLDTIEILNKVLPIVLDATLAIFGVVFTGYAFFQALLSKEHLSVLIEDIQLDEKNNRGQNTLYKTNWNFVQLMMQFLISIFATLLLQTVLSCMATNFCLFENMWLNEILASLLIMMYIFHLMVIMWRMISFVFNIFQLFNSYAVTKYLSYIKNGNDDE